MQSLRVNKAAAAAGASRNVVMTPRRVVCMVSLLAWRCVRVSVERAQQDRTRSGKKEPGRQNRADCPLPFWLAPPALPPARPVPDWGDRGIVCANVAVSRHASPPRGSRREKRELWDYFPPSPPSRRPSGGRRDLRFRGTRAEPFPPKPSAIRPRARQPPAVAPGDPRRSARPRIAAAHRRCRWETGMAVPPPSLPSLSSAAA